MSTVRKLTEPDKHEILKLYRETAETTSTLAERYDVSNSTISRLLKSTLPEDEYEYLVSLKRAARTPEGRAQVNYDNLPAFTNQPQEDQTQKQEVLSPVVEQNVVETQPQRVSPAQRQIPKPKDSPAPQVSPLRLGAVAPGGNPQDLGDYPQEEPVVAQNLHFVELDEPTHPSRRLKRRSSAPTKPILPIQQARSEQPVAEQLELLEQKPPEITSIPSPLLEDTHPNANVIAEMFGEDLLDESDDLEDLDDDDDDDYDEEDFEPAAPLVTRPRSGDALVKVLPLSAAALPKTCYLVIDRSSELITRPLREFGDLGQIPSLETQQRTLPVFDNHRIAKRFSTKRDRVIKIPDTKMLHKARYHLQAKGITRLLIDGQVYSLSSV
ncbi:transposase [Brasilonema bromeliae SPC951]|uniref:Transposase n=1 Tax=Brasilonema bromeliae SPC951 TaxID=385972 RepID=A0ABX1P4V2_9CYAN|nr:transposase [Brasilonema bromeliae SPC951]